MSTLGSVVAGMPPNTPAARSSNCRLHSVTWFGCTSCLCAISAMVLPSPKASIATLALNAAEWLRRGRLLMSCAPVIPRSILALRSNSSTLRRVQFCAATSRYAGYAFMDTERRQVCWAHLMRDFPRIGQRHGLAGQIGRRLLGLGLVMFRKREKAQLNGGTLEGLKRRMRMTLQRGAEQDQCSRTANTCTNILKLWPALWTFTTHSALVPTNNATEQTQRASCSSARSPGPRAHCAATNSWPRLHGP